MSNMSYCRFENTLGDLRDCKNALDEMRDRESQLRHIAPKKERFKVLEALTRDMTEDEEDEYDELFEEIDKLDGYELSEYEQRAKVSLLQLCEEIAEEYGDDDE